jgi:hypothetical protein
MYQVIADCVYASLQKQDCSSYPMDAVEAAINSQAAMFAELLPPKEQPVDMAINANQAHLDISSDILDIREGTVSVSCQNCGNYNLSLAPIALINAYSDSRANPIYYNIDTARHKFRIAPRLTKACQVSFIGLKKRCLNGGYCEGMFDDYACNIEGLICDAVVVRMLVAAEEYEKAKPLYDLWQQGVQMALSVYLDKGRLQTWFDQSTKNYPEAMRRMWAE